MEDSIEEFEPLFDYSRVQPVNFVDLEDDSDSSPANSPKRRKCSETKNNNNEDNNDDKGKSVQVIASDEEEDEKENWLPPPPKNVGNLSKVPEDSTIKELRLKRQQLVSVVQSTEHAIRAADEAASRTFATSSQNDAEETIEEVLKPAVDRAKIVVSIQDKAGIRQCRVYADEKFELLFKNYAQKANNDLDNLVFCFDGEKINPATTPQALGMEDDDLIEVHVKGS